MDESFHKYFSINRYFMISTGSWPYQTGISAIAAQLCFILQHISIIVPEIIKLFNSTDDIDLVFESVPPIFYNLLIAVMFVCLTYNTRKTKCFLEKINGDWLSLNNAEDRQILSNYAEVGILMSWVYIVSCYSTLLLYCAVPLEPIIMDFFIPLNESRPKIPLYRTEFFVDENKYFYPILLHNFLTTILGMFALVNLDIYIATTTQHICGMLAILGRRLQNIQKEKIVGKLEDGFFHETVTCVKLHINILDLLKIMTDTISFSFAILLVILLAMLTFTGLVVVIKWGQWTEVIRFVLFTSAELFHIFCYSYHSQNLLNHHEQLFNAIQFSGLYESSIRTRRLINIMLLRCSRPFLILCLIFPLSMQNFTLIVKTSFSYFTAVKSVR
ncbi:odorant receptor 13a-like [Phymastichus coffea]|uniref:odorant receptor 13a-like n=1 Tax=Phymastichus coffea TaxID=108790 RepID=UPI00273CAD6D|nr:odorant receptor 13a-like [Phymastichus coffea]